MDSSIFRLLPFPGKILVVPITPLPYERMRNPSVTSQWHRINILTAGTPAENVIISISIPSTDPFIHIIALKSHSELMI
jgi:hypothetical protein